MKFTNNITALILSVLLVAALFASCMPAKNEESQGESSLPEVSESTPDSSSESEEPEEQPPEPKEYYAKDYEFEIPDFPDAETERLALIDGTIAGSATNLMDCMRFTVKEAGIPLETAVMCATENPAKEIGIFHETGSIAAGKKADLIVIDPHGPSMMPVNDAYPVEQLIQTVRRYQETTGRRVSFEYSMVRGVNDSDVCAKQLADLIRGMGAHVNLIPINPVDGSPYSATDAANVRRFQKMLEDLGVNATIRRRLGTDISAACGQLRREDAKQAEQATRQTTSERTNAQ